MIISMYSRWQIIILSLIWLSILVSFLIPRYCVIIHGNPNFIDGIIIIILIILPLMLIFHEVDILGIKIKQPRRNGFDKPDGKIPPPQPEKNSDDIVIPFKTCSVEIEKDAKGDNTFLSFKARIHFRREAGSQELLKIWINDNIIESKHSVNKDFDAVISEGRSFQWYNKDTQSWRIPYSPNFKTNYYHFHYRVLNCDAYYFIFNLTKIQPNANGKYIIKFEHNGKEGDDAFENAIVVRNIDTF